MTFIKYKKSSSYMQRQINYLLKSLRDFAKVYIDDIITFFKILSKHLKHLRKFFTLFRQRRINLNPKKSFLRYSFITLLDQKINSLNLSTIKKKFAVITSLHFPISLRKLKTFFDLTN